ncbi:uncharacterized protein V1510DRAFT_414684 [Dipodascopsis tothii]|uniref:uncharacterized protein n=1 Tax=Dipodascopsis tothii TaxID=44089 RepID=UPI0034CDBE77
MVEKLMTVYLTAFAALVISTVFTTTSIFLPHWLTARFPVAGSSQIIRLDYGLHQKCSSETNPSCVPFPAEECSHGGNFCGTWKTVTFGLYVSLLFLGVLLASYIALLAGSRAKRETAWRPLAVLLAIDTAIQGACLAAVFGLLQTDNHYLASDNWRLGQSWILIVVAFTINLVVIVFTVVTGLHIRPGYDSLPTRPSMRRLSTSLSASSHV